MSDCHANPKGTMHCDRQSWSDTAGTWTRCCWCGRTIPPHLAMPNHGPFKLAEPIVGWPLPESPR